MDKIKIKLKATGGTEVYINDTKLSGVTGVEFKQDVETLPKATITMWASEVEIDTEGNVEFSMPKTSKATNCDFCDRRKKCLAENKISKFGEQYQILPFTFCPKEMEKMKGE